MVIDRSHPVVVYGPQFGAMSAGGMQTHMNVLSGLHSFRSAKFIPLGNRSGLSGRITTLKQLFNPNLYAPAVCANAIFINSSFYESSLLKLLAFLWRILRISNSDARIYVFFHGGRVHRANSILRKVWARVLADPRVSLYFLTEEQRIEYLNFCPSTRADRTNRFLNFSLASTATSSEGSHENVRALCVGRVVAEKGQAIACEAVRILNRQRPGAVCLTILGDGPELARLRVRYQAESDNGTIVFGGFRTGAELADFYRASDILLMPTSWPEGLPYVLIEAYEHGLPVAATRVGALPEHITPVADSLLLASASVAEVIRAIQEITLNPQLLIDARRTAANYFNHTFAKQCAETFYGSLIGRPESLDD